MPRTPLLLLALAAAAAGCDRPAPAAATSTQLESAAPATAPAAAENGSIRDALAGLEAEVSGMDLYMHDIKPTGDTRRKPTLWIHAAKAQSNADKTLTLADATAVIYRDQDEDIHLESKAGRFDESRKIALLEGGVSVAAGKVSMQTDSVSYDNNSRVVETLSPVVLSDGETVLTAEKATLEPDAGLVTLTNVSGTLSLAGELE